MTVYIEKNNRMQDFLPKIKININPNIFIKDPETSELGGRILSESVNMIDNLGFEDFTFKKLSQRIDSTEASIYRYFESKHKLLLYLTAWYWGWLEYRLVFGISNISSATDRLARAIKIITEGEEMEFDLSNIDVEKLSQIIISESSKTYLTIHVDQENQEGAFEGYKQLVKRVSDIILEINPSCKYPHMLVSTVIEGAHQQRFFSKHLPSLTDKTDEKDTITSFYTQLVFKYLKIEIANNS